MQSPTLHQSPYRLPPLNLPKSASGNDLVSGIVDKFNSLSVVDRDEQRAQYEREMSKLKAAVDRAQVAREEAESEARKLREKLLDLQDERQKEKAALRERAQEFEKKYEKAKDRFKMQRAKHADEIHKAQKEHLENEKRHWRSVAIAQEEMEWERQLRIEAHDLLEFIQLEMQFGYIRRTTDVARKNVKSLSPGPEQDIDSISFQTAQESEDIVIDIDVSTEETTTQAEATDTPQPRADSALSAAKSPSPTPSAANETAITDDEPTAAPPSSSARTAATSDIAIPARQNTRSIPVHFNDADPSAEDKENQTPQPEPQPQSQNQLQTPAKQPSQAIQEILKTPLTIDRAAALAAIEYRRGRAKSFVAAQQTPRKVSGAERERRDISAPALGTVGHSGGLGTMSVGRKR